MNAIRLKKPGGLDKLYMDSSDPVAPGPGQVRVRNHASSLNFHDYAVAIGMIKVEEGRIPMSDGAGVIEEIGEGVTDFAVGDKVVSCFFPNWADGRADAFAKITDVPGDQVDGFAAQSVTMSQTAFTQMPAGYSFEEAAALRRTDRLARSDGGGQGESR